MKGKLATLKDGKFQNLSGLECDADGSLPAPYETMKDLLVEEQYTHDQAKKVEKEKLLKTKLLSCLKAYLK
jgi:hypothetical protein